MVKYKDLFDQIKIDEMRFQRGSICTNKGKESNLSDSYVTKNINNKNRGKIDAVERAILYHLATKVIADDNRVVQQLVKKQITKMFKSSRVFKGNVRRLQAYCLMNELYKQDETRTEFDQKTFKVLEIEDCLIRARKSFEQDNCTWGLALTNLQEAIFINNQMKVLSAKKAAPTRLTAKEQRVKMTNIRHSSEI